MKTIGMKIGAVVIGLMLLVGLAVGTATPGKATSTSNASNEFYNITMLEDMGCVPETDKDDPVSYLNTQYYETIFGLFEDKVWLQRVVDGEHPNVAANLSSIHQHVQCYSSALSNVRNHYLSATPIAELQNTNASLVSTNSSLLKRVNKVETSNRALVNGNKSLTVQNKSLKKTKSTAKRQVNKLCKTKALKRAPKSTKRLCTQLKKTVR